MTEESPRRWHVAQAGAREHYAVARAFLARGQLTRLYTGSWCRHGTSLLRRGPAPMRAFAGRQHPNVPSTLVRSFDVGAMAWDLHRRLWSRPKNVEAVYRWEIANSEWFARRVLASMRLSALEPDRDCFFGYQSECLEVLQRLGDRGVRTVIDLAGPGQVEDRLVAQEARRWPGWASMDPVVPSFYYDRVLSECRTASIALVNSAWSQRAWIEQGVPNEKIIVVPLAYEPSGPPPEPRSAHDRPLTVLWLGSVILRKGIPYLIEAARILQHTTIRFIVAGPIGIAERVVQDAPANMQFLGRITRDQTSRLYQDADIFVIPTISDGFAITQLEAMAHGVPVIATHNCGDVVTHGEDGLLVPAGDADSLAAAILRLNDDRVRLAAMSAHALVKSGQFSLDRFATEVNAAIDSLKAPFQPRAARGA